MEPTKNNKHLDALVKELSEQLTQGKPLTGQDGVFTPLLKRVIEASLEGEMDAPLQAEKGSGSNRRNGRGSKNVQSSLGGFEVFTPRDRAGSVTPQTLPKRQRRITSDVDTKILSLYRRGMSYRDIQAHLVDMYGVEISTGTLSAITDRILPQILDWQSRPLDSVYPVMWLDAMHFKVREHGKVISKAVYSVLAVNTDGIKQVLGIYFGDIESASFSRSVLHELQPRGVKDLFVACIDNLSGFGDAIEALFPQTDVQLCLVHQMRNSLKYVNYKDYKAVSRDLRKVYTALNDPAALQYLEQAEHIWGAKYKVIFRSWHSNWDRLTNFYKYPPALRGVIYTNNPIESYHRMVRKGTKTKGAFSSENAIVKQIYLATINAQTKWSGTIFGWSSVRRDLVDYFDDRFLTPHTL
ncbi:MAG: IS256 family transposase [Gracilimonas sp.]|uniref:IS256 family transposase n=1 Tax=Gracilimonas sp. TaxID=1974203 RepID=UPI00375397CD|nr:IS256 family transposase [Gracilimonas sp.]